MKPVSNAGWIFLKVVLIFVGLIALWPVVGSAYRGVYREVANVVFGSVGWSTTATFEPWDKGGDTHVILRPPRDGPHAARHVPFFVHGIAYLPTIELLALTLAVPMPWSRRWKALLWGLVGLSLFVGFETALVILYSMTDASIAAPIIPVSPATGEFVADLYKMFVESPTLSLIAPVLIWALACLPRTDFLGNLFASPSADTGGKNAS